MSRPFLAVVLMLGVAPVAEAGIPMHFDENAGQTDARVRFIAHGSGYSFFIAGDEAVAVFKTRSAVRMQLRGANGDAVARGEEILPGKSNFFTGSDPSKWRTNVAQYAKVRLRGVYRGIDVVYYGNERQLEYDFIVTPGADPRQIRLHFEGADRIDTDRSGDLVLHVKGGELRQRLPVVYQEQDGRRRPIHASYRRIGARDFAVDVAAYDSARPLVIDPTLAYSTYLGGNALDEANAIALDAAGNVYLTGNTSSTNFPTASPFQSSNAGSDDVFVTKVNAAGSALIYSTYIGGGGSDIGIGIAVDGAGNAYVSGETASINFPTMNQIAGAKGSALPDAFVLKLNAAGSALVYSSYVGGSLQDGGTGIAVDGSGNAYFTGRTFSLNFPTMTPFQPTIGVGASSDAFVTKVNPAGSALVYSTYLGGSGNSFGVGIAVDGSGNAYVTGGTSSPNFPTMNPFQAVNGGSTDAFLTKFNAAGTALVYSTYLGGNGIDQGHHVVLDGSGSAYLGGETGSTNFPTASPIQASFGGGSSDGFATKFNAAGSALVYSSYLGGAADDRAFGIALDSSNNAYLTGFTFSSNFPTVNPFQPNLAGAQGNAFVTEVNAAGSAFIYSTYLGGCCADNGNAIVVDSGGNAIVAGRTSSQNFPRANAIQPVYGGDLADAFLTKLAPGPSPTVPAIDPRALAALAILLGMLGVIVSRR